MAKRCWIEAVMGTILLLSAFIVFTVPGMAHPKYLTAEKKTNPDVKSCTYCHVSANGKAA